MYQNLNNQINKLKTEQSDHKKKQNKIIDDTLNKIK